MNTDVRAIADKYLTKVKTSGPEHIMATCPFHRRPDGGEEQNPSFTMSVTQGLYHCFSCHESGNLPKFLEAMGLSAVAIDRDYKYLLEELEKARPIKADPLHMGAAADVLPESLLGIFDYCPYDLLEDGFSEKLLRELDIGFDNINQRITYPLRDQKGQLVGISGRTVLDEWPRYKVYDIEYLAWGLKEQATKKRLLLWNLHRVYPIVYFDRTQTLTIVEGFKACMRLLESGITNTIALLGSFMSKEQMWMIESLGSKTIYLMLDNDDAGKEGRIRIGRALCQSHPDVRIVEYAADQPSDLNAEQIQQALMNATDYHLWKIQGRHRPLQTPKETRSVP